MSPLQRYSFPMTVPPASQLVDVLKKGLTPNFEKVMVEWVDCPNLTYSPFNLAAPGLRGNTAMLQVGGTGYMFPEMKTEIFANFVNLIQIIKRSSKHNFLIGGCISSQDDKRVGEVTVNTLVKKNNLHSVCGSRMAYWTNRGPKTRPILTLDHHNCAMMGNFYISEGKPGAVLKVYAKKRIGDVEFINAMQSALAKHFPFNFMSNLCVGLGGVFIATQGNMRHHVIPPSWSGIRSENDLLSSLHYFNIEAPVIGVGSFLSTNTQVAKKVNARPCFKPMALTTRQFHTFSSDATGGFYERDHSSDVVEYFGFFHPAERIHRVSPSVYPHITNLNV